MRPLVTITPNTQAFAFFFSLAFGVGALLLLYCGKRRNWPLLDWFTVITCGAIAGLAGSKLMVIPYAAWLPNLAAGHLPATMEKTFLGGLLGGMLGIWLARRALGFRHPASDAYALVLPVAMAIGRIGCLLGGCCFGTPCRLPWAVAYGSGSEALEIHAGQSLIEPAAAVSLPIHPLQVYDALLMLGLVLVLIRIRRRLKQPGSLFLLYVGLYAITRFGEEFLREGGATAWGLKLVQWGLLGAAGIALTVFIFNERRLRSESRAASGPQGRLRTALVVAVILTAVVAGRHWFTPLEKWVIWFHAVPLAIAAAIAILPVRLRFRAREGVLTLAAGSVLLVSSDSAHTRNGFYNYDVGGGGGAYQEICGSARRYAIGSVGASRTEVFGPYSRVEFGVRGYGGVDMFAGSPMRDTIVGVNPYLQADARWIGGGIGVHLGDIIPGSGSKITVIPQFSLRFGPSDVLFIEGSYADHFLGGIPQPLFKFALGHEFPNGSSLRTGIAYNGFFVEPRFALGRQFVLNTYGSYGDAANYALGVGLRWHFGFGPMFSSGSASKD